MRLCEYGSDAEFEAAYLAEHGLTEADLGGETARMVWRSYTWTHMQSVEIDPALADANMKAMNGFYRHRGFEVTKEREVWATRVGDELHMRQIVDIVPMKKKRRA